MPEIWFLEIANVLAMAERRGRIATGDSTIFVTELGRFDFEIDREAPGRAFDDILPLCRAHQLTSYNAVYLDLAVRRRLPLATLDRPLRKAAQTLGVELLGE